MSDFWRGWMYAALLILAVMVFGPVAVEALQWRPDNRPPQWVVNFGIGIAESAPVLIVVVGTVFVLNVAFQVYLWMRRVIREGEES